VLTGKMSAVLEPMYACCAVVTGKMSAVLEPMYVLIFVVFLCVAFRVLRLCRAMHVVCTKVRDTRHVWRWLALLLRWLSLLLPLLPLLLLLRWRQRQLTLCALLGQNRRRRLCAPRT
jgi:hypothetical protein